MGNMSYCRFRNTERDLADCLSNMGDTLDKEEHEARTQLIKMCKEIVDNYGDSPETLPQEREEEDEEEA